MHRKYSLFVFLLATLMSLFSYLITYAEETVYFPLIGNVSGNTVTSTPTNTVSPTNNPAATPTSTLTPTSTTAPANTATPTNTPTPTSTLVPGALTKLYLNKAGEMRLEPAVGFSVYFVRNGEPLEFDYVLTGDIVGNEYEYGLFLSQPGATVLAEIIVNEQILSSSQFVVTSDDFTRYSSRVDGINPSTSAGDILTLRISLVAGSVANIYQAPAPNGDSHIALRLN